jgi:hypothetical protein
MLFDELKNEFYLNEHEKSQHSKFAMAQFVAAHEKEILRAFNEAHRSGEDPDQAVNQVIGQLLKKAQKKDEQ